MVGVISVILAMVVPMTASSLAAYRFQGDGQAVSNMVSLAKMRAASQFSRARVYVDRTTNSYSLQLWDKNADAWVVAEGVRRTSPGVSFGYGTLATPPPDTQAAIGFSAACTNDDGSAIANTACIVFNSRGIPINPATGAPQGGNAIYLTDGVGVYGVTVTATPLVRFWWSPAHSARWVEQQ